MKITIYQRVRSGVKLDQVTGIEFRGGLVWRVPAKLLKGYEPAAGDRVRSAEGVWLTVASAELIGGADWDLTCTAPS